MYKHKIEVDLSDEMSDRYIYMFSDGRLTSGLFQCYCISQDEYVYGIKKIIDAIPMMKKELLTTIENFKNNMEKHKYKCEISNIKDKSQAVMVGDRNYDILGAKEHGLDSMGVLFGFGDLEELTNAGATYIAETVEEILKYV